MYRIKFKGTIAGAGERKYTPLRYYSTNSCSFAVYIAIVQTVAVVQYYTLQLLTNKYTATEYTLDRVHFYTL